MRTHFPSREIPHLWAHQRAEHGRSASALSFSGPAVSSYGTEIGRIVTNKAGQTAYLVNMTSYSVTTAKHQSWVRSAIPHDAIVFRCENYGRGTSLINEPKELYRQALSQSALALESAAKRKRASTREADESSALGWLEQAKAVVKFYGLRYRVDEAAIQRLVKSNQAAARRKAKEEAERQKKLERDNAEPLADWLAGKDVEFPWSVQKTFLRVVNGEVQTSQGVIFPLKDAKRALRFIRLMRTKGWRRNGEKFEIGGYQLDSVSETCVIAGCHHLTWEEIDRAAATQGW
jgi:hypothetical protein